MFVKFLALLFCISVAQAGLLDLGNGLVDAVEDGVGTVKDGVDNAVNSTTSVIPDQCKPLIGDLKKQLEKLLNTTLGQIVNIGKLVVKELQKNVGILSDANEQAKKIKPILDDLVPGNIDNVAQLLSALADVIKVIREDSSITDDLVGVLRDLTDLLGSEINGIEPLIQNVLKDLEGCLGLSNLGL